MVQLHEMILRDAHQSMLATRMRTEDMLPIAEKIDQVGFFSLEVWGGATFDVSIRYLNQDPWERIRLLKKAMPNTPMQMLERAMSIVAYRNFPDDIVKKFIYFAKKNGVDYFRIFDALNDLRNMEVPMKAVKKNGGHVQACLSYTISPVHTVDYFVAKFKELKKMGADSLCIKDMAGMISPKCAYDLIKGCRNAGIKLPMDLHSHCTSGMTGMAYMRAVEAGVDILDTAMSPISGGTGQPATESIVAALKDTEYDTGYDMDTLMECRKYFLKVWDKYRHLHRETAMEVDPSVTVHQIPGGMLSNLLFQLEQQGAVDKYDEVLAETPRVRKDFGYPPLVTPTSQIVGVQAVMNVLFGRYKKIPKETREYVRGMYGTPPGEISKEIYKTILGPNWKDEIIDCRPSDLLEPMYKKRKDELEEMGLLKKPEDVLTYAIYPQVGLKFLKGETKAEFTSDQLPLMPKRNQIDLSDKIFNVEVDSKLYHIKVKIGREKEEQPIVKQRELAGEPLHAPMQGAIIKINAKVGGHVNKGDIVALLEAMKMENEIISPRSGIVTSINVSSGQDVNAEDVIMVIK